MSVVGSLSKQRLPSRVLAQLIGAAYTQSMRTVSYWGAVNAAILMVLGWDSGIGGWFRAAFPWFSIWWFMLLGVVAVLVVNAIDYIIVVPSWYAFANRQMAVHDSPVLDAIIVVQKEQAELRTAIARIEKRLETNKNV